MAEPEKIDDQEVPEGSGAGNEEPTGDDHLAGGPMAVSVFVADPEGLPESIDSAFWKACPSFGDGFGTPDGSSPLKQKTLCSVAHDARYVAFHVACEEPEMGRVWTRRTGEVGRLDLDDSVEILLDPYHAHGFHWSFVVTPAGEWEMVPPIGAVAGPECVVEVRTGEKGWEALVRVPVVDVGLEGDLRGSPLDGDVWGLAVARRRRESTSGAREIAAWAGELTLPVTSEKFGHLRFQGGRQKRPVEFTRYVAGGFGVNEICVVFPGEKGGSHIPPDVEVEVRPAPAKRLRSKDISRCKFRVALPGLYRYSVRIPYAPPAEATEEEIVEIEAEIGKESEVELTEEELTQKLGERLAERQGTPEYAAGLSFLLPDLWSEVEGMEDAAQAARVKLEDEGVGTGAKMTREFNKFEDSLNAVDRYRAPHAKDRLGADQIEKLREQFDELGAAVRKALLRAGKLSVASPYLAGGSWHRGVLRCRTKHSCGTSSAAELAGKLKAAGLSFCAFADTAEGGDQDGDGEHDWNGDGTVSPDARIIKGTGRAVAEDRGREAYVIDYSRSAADQGKPWVAENWKLSEPGSFVVIPAVEVGPHYPALCLGAPAGGLPAGSQRSYEVAGPTQEAGGVAVLCEAPGDLRELPVELANVIGIDVPADAWDRLLVGQGSRGGRKILLFPCATLDAADLTESGLPDNHPRVGVLAESLTEEGILKALRRGSFYVTSGPEITDIEVRGDTVKIRTAEPCQIFFRGKGGQMLGGTFGTEAEYRFTGHEQYVRAVCLADVLEDGSRVEALTQAFYLADSLPVSPVGDTEWTIAEPVDTSARPEGGEEEESRKEAGEAEGEAEAKSGEATE